MGLFDLFKSKSKDNGTGEKKKSGAAAKWAEAAGSKRAQAYDRQEAIQELSKLGTAEAVEALLKRFTFQIDPSITDQEEKELAFDGILKAGQDAIEPVRAFTAKAESLGWPIRIAKELLDEEELVEELEIFLAGGLVFDARARLLDAVEPRCSLLERAPSLERTPRVQRDVRRAPEEERLFEAHLHRLELAREDEEDLLHEIVGLVLRDPEATKCSPDECVVLVDGAP